MTFTELLQLVESSNPKIRVAADSRWVTRGDIFVAVKGTAVDGHDFIDQAVKNGAAYIVAQKSVKCDPAQLIIARSTSRALALLAHASANHPTDKLTNLAVTGTNGKTSVCYLTQSIIKSAGAKCGMIGTVVCDTGDSKNIRPSTLTTPGPLEMATLATQMVESKTKYMVTEASSHALHQNRLAGINFTAAAFTNLTGDHLDYHKTPEEYLNAKSLLFEQLPPHAIAVLNKNSPMSEVIAERISNRIIWYALNGQADLYAYIEEADVNHTIYNLNFEGQRVHVKTKLIGDHNVSNQLAAAGLALAAGFDIATVAKGLTALENIPGRLERIEGPKAANKDFTVFVDYAHTDDALRNVLATLRPICFARLIVVFGCGGGRDKSKRPRMATAAEELADMIYITSDNPRTESPQAIIDDITKGLTAAGKKKSMINPDRKTAITQAIENAGEDDIVLIAGKGHEDYQIIGTEKIDFDDRKIAAKLLEE